LTQARFKCRFRAKEILIKSSHKGGSDDVEAPSSSFYKICWSLKQTHQIFALGARRKRKFTPFGIKNVQTLPRPSSLLAYG